MENKNLQTLINDANKVVEWLADLLENEKGLYQDRTLNYSRILENKARLMREFNLKNDRTFNKYFREFKDNMEMYLEEYMFDNDVEDIRRYNKNKTFNLKNGIISTDRNGSVDIPVTVLWSMFNKLYLACFINCFFENDRIVDVDKAKEIITELKKRNGDYITIDLNIFKEDLEYICTNLKEDFLDRMYDSFMLDDYFNDLDMEQVNLFENYLMQVKGKPTYYNKYPRFF